MNLHAFRVTFVDPDDLRIYSVTLNARNSLAARDRFRRSTRGSECEILAVAFVQRFPVSQNARVSA